LMALKYNVPHLDNRDTDHLAWITSSRAPTPPDVIIKKLNKPSVKVVEPVEEADLMVIDGPEQQLAYDWMSPIRAYLGNQPLSDDNAEIEHVACTSRMHHLIDGLMYRQGVNGIMMRCIFKEGIQLLQDIHSGVCEAHSSWCSIIEKAFRHRFYWLTAKDDATEIVTKCKDSGSSRTKPRSMRILFIPSISPIPLQSGKLTLLASYQGRQEDSDSYLSASICSPSGWRPPQW
jgi:hypothetical protein